jgi:Tol biopolymer transport system component
MSKPLAIALCALATWLVVAPPASATNPGPSGKIAFVRSGDIWSVNPDGSALTQLTKTGSVTEDDPAFSPDGNYIAYTRNSNGYLFIMRADGSEPHFVASIFEGKDLAWSPDGSKIAYRIQGFADSTDGLWMVHPDGSDRTRVFAATDIHSGPSWSPDGTKIAFSRPAPPSNAEEIWTMNSDGSGATSITASSSVSNHSREPSWSPDGSKIGFVHDSDYGYGDSEIYTVPSGGGPTTQVSNLSGSIEADPSWSPDGTKIVFTSCVVDAMLECHTDIYLMDADGTDVTLLEGAAADEFAPEWQPAVGPSLPPIPNYLDKIVFSSTRNECCGSEIDDVFTMNPDGSGQRPLTDGGAFEGEPAWSPDGSKIAFASNRAGNNFEIYVMKPDGTGLTNLTQTVDPNINELSPAWAPDGSKIAYRRDFGSDDHRIWVMNANGTGQTQVTPGPRDYWPAWSPDGAKIAFSHLNAIYTMNPDGTGLTPLTTVPVDGRDSEPDWSPNGTAIAFDRYPASGSANIWKVNADGSGQQQLTTGGAVFPSWSPDGTKIAFSRRSSNGFYADDIFVMNADGTGQVDITNSLGTDTTPDWRPVAGYARPKGASPFRISLVPSSRQCTAPNDTHGAPLSFGSCAPPVLASDHLTTGTPDSNDRAALMNAYMLLNVTPGNVSITARVNDVFDKGLSDYTGSLHASLPIRITDRDNSPAPNGSGAGTTQPFQFGFDVPCAVDPDPTVGSSCSLETTADTLVPGAIEEGERAIWQIGRARVDDGGADADGSTTADNTVFAVQGVFVP